MMLSSARSCLIKMSIFLLGIAFVGVCLIDILKTAFLYNIYINSVIVGCVISGIILIFHRVLRYDKEYRLLLRYDSLSREAASSFKLLKPVTLYTTRGSDILPSSKIQTMMASVDKKVDDFLSFPKYLTGILIFLGLLGTFWGLSHTIGNVAEIIDKLGVGEQDPAESFETLKNSLKVPLAGMGIAFGCSLFGLSGSLIVGFLNINQKRVADDFLDKTEEWVAKRMASFDSVDNQMEYHGKVFSMALLEKTIETIYAFQKQLNEFDINRKDLMTIQRDVSQKLGKLSEALTLHQDVIKMLAKNQIELQNTVLMLTGKLDENNSRGAGGKLDSIDASLSKLLQESIEGRNIMIQSLGGDIRMISKTLSALLRE